jgi:hypothetical protein
MATDTQLYVDENTLGLELGTSLDLAGKSPVKPDDEAALRDASKRLNIPLDTARTLPQETKQLAQQSTFDPIDYSQKYPNAAKFLADQNNALVAHDDVQPLSAVESAVLNNKQHSQSLADSVERGIGQLGVLGELTATGIDRALSALGSMFLPEPKYGGNVDVRNRAQESSLATVAQGYVGMPRDLRMDVIAQIVNDAHAQGATFGGVTDAIGYMAQNPGAVLNFFGEMIPAAVVGGGIGGAAVKPLAGAITNRAVSGYVTGAAVSGAATAAGAYPAEFANRLNENGGNVDEALGYAGTKATVEGGVNALFGGIGGALPIGSTLAGRVGNVLGQAGAQAVGGGAGAAAASAAVGETISAGELFLESFLELVTAPSDIAIAAAVQAQQNADARQVQAEQAQMAAGNLEQLLAAAAQSQTRVRAPESFSQLVQDAAVTGGSITEVYFDAQPFVDVLEQSGLTPEQIERVLPSVRDNLAAAVSSNGTIMVPIGELTTAFAGTGVEQSLLQQARTAPDALSVADTEQAQALVEQLQQDAEGILAQQEQRKAWDDSARQVFDTMSQQLNTAGRFSPDVNKTLASVVRDYYTVIAGRTSTTPAELYQRFPLRVSGVMPTAKGNEVLEQGSPELQRALAMSEDDYIAAVNPTGKTLDAEDRMILHVGDLDTPSDAKPVSTFNDSNGTPVQVMRDGSGIMYAVRDGETLGMMGPLEDNETVIDVVEEAKGQGVGRGLAAAYIRENPMAPSGGFSPAGEANRRSAFRALKASESLNQSVQQTETKAFKEWAGTDRPVVEPSEINDFDFNQPGPFVVRGFHGTTNTFSEFNAGVKGNVEGQFGAVNYFTSSEQDAGDNYAGEGPDLTQRIELKAERLVDEITDVYQEYENDEDGVAALKEQYGEDVYSEDFMVMARNIARKELHGGDEIVMEVFIRTEKPFVVGDVNSPWIEFFDESKLEADAMERVADNTGVDIADIEAEIDEYSDQIDDARYEIMDEQGNAVVQAVQTVAERYDFDPSDLLAELYDMASDGSVRHNRLEEFMRQSESLTYAERPDDGAIVQSQMIGEIIQELGFDSIILKNANVRFKSMNMERGTAHVHVFDANNTNIKSATDNNGNFDRNDPNILNQFAGERALTANQQALADAQAQLAAGADPEAVRQATGWFKGAEGKWRFEIADGDAKLTPTLDAMRYANRDGETITSVTYREAGGLWVVQVATDGMQRPTDIIELTTDNVGSLRPVLGSEIVNRLQAGEGEPDVTSDNDADKYLTGEGQQFSAPTGRWSTIGEVLDHPRLFQAYPQLADMRVVYAPEKLPAKVSGAIAFDTRNNEPVMILGDVNARELRKTVLHELQHGIQRIEGFALGGSSDKLQDSPQYRHDVQNDAQTFREQQNPDAAQENLDDLDALEIYHRLAGEAEARNVEARADFSERVAAAVPPQRTADVKDADALVTWNAIDMYSEVVDQAAAPMAQQGDAPRATFTPETLNIALLEKANLSSFLHELGHFFFEMQATLASQPGAPQQINDDMGALLKFVEFDGTAAEWLALPVNARRDAHEKVAESFEQYLFEGKAPSLEMQSLFSRMRAWMNSVYRTLQQFLQTNRNANLTDEVRGVFDRMLATDAQIEAARAARSFGPMFESAEQAGMTPEQFDEYRAGMQQEVDDATRDLDSRRLRDMRWLQNYRGKKLRELQKESRAKRAAVQEEVTKEIDAQRPYQVLNFIRKGVLPDGVAKPDGMASTRLNRGVVESMYGETFKVPDLLLAKNGVDPEAIATLFGYASADQMIREVAATEPRTQLIAGLTDQRMLERYGDLASAESVERAADAAIASDVHARMVATELAAVTKQLGSVRAIQRAARDFAERSIGSKAIKYLRPDQAAADAARHRKAAEQALKKGDTNAAVDAKRNELLALELQRAQTQAKTEIVKARDSMRKLFGRDEQKAKSRDMNMVNAARAIVAQYGLAPTAGGLAADNYMELIAQNDPALATNLQSLIAQAPAPKPFKDLNVDEFRVVRDLVQSLYYMSRRTKQMEIDGQKVELDAVADELVQRITDLNGGEIPPIPGYDSTPTKWDHLKLGALGARAMGTRVEQWAGMMGPQFTKYVWNPVTDAITAYRTKRNEMVGKYRDLLKQIEPTMSYRPIYAPELGPAGFTFNAGKAELLHALLHSGNDSNLKKMLVGRNWGTVDENGNFDRSRWDAFVARAFRENILTKVDMDFAQGVWDLLETTKTDAQRAHREMFGFYFNEVTANPVQTPWGEYRGGYVPAVADPISSPDAAQKREAEDMNAVGNSYMFPTTGKGFTQSRVEYNRPLQLDLRTLSSHIDKVTRFSFVEPAVRDVAKLVTSKRVNRALNGHDRGAVDKMLLPWLQRAAQQTTSLTGKDRYVDKFFRNLRSRSGMFIMFANVVNTMQQITGFSVAALKVPAPVLLRATYRYIQSPKVTAAEAANLSPWLSQRLGNQAFEMTQQIDAMLIDPNAYEKAEAFMKRNAYFMQTAVQNVMDVIVWTGAYDNALAKGADGKQAVRYADEAVRTTQGTFAPEDVSAMEVQTPFVQLFTQFWGYFNMLANTLGTEAGKAIRDMGYMASTKRLAFVWFAGLAIPAVVAEIIANGVPDDDDDEDGDGVLDEYMAMFFGSQGRTLTAMVPIAGQAAQLAWNKLDDKWYNDRFNISPAVSMSEGAIGAVASVLQGKAFDERLTKTEVREMATLIGLATGMPTNVISRPVGYMLDVEAGKKEADSAARIAWGLTTGR